LKKPIYAVFVVGGVWHDFDFARLEILKLLAEDDRIRTRVFEDYDSAAKALPNADFLVSYTCNVTASVETQEALKGFVEGGKKWYALHGTNSVLRFLSPEGAEYGELLVNAPRWMPLFMETVGSQFIAHPPIAPFTVKTGEGSVLYLTLGHCRGHYDMQGIADYYPEVERCAWDIPVFYTLLRRGISWAKSPALIES